jgi:hypothetical protein
MLGVALFACLSTANHEVRNSDLYALHCELSVFPPEVVTQERWNAAKAYCEWLQVQALTDGRYDSPIQQAHVRQQFVCATYFRLDLARGWVADGTYHAANRADCGWKNAAQLRRLIGDEAYHAGKLPAPIPTEGQ